MKTSLLLILLLVMTASLRAADSGRDPQYDQILAALQSQIEFLRPETIKEELTPTKVWEETDKGWAAVMKNFRAMLAKQGMENRKDLVHSKEQVHESWKRQCRVLFDRLSEKGAVLRRYDEGAEGSSGYAILVNGKPKYWLHWRFNRDRDDY